MVRPPAKPPAKPRGKPAGAKKPARTRAATADTSTARARTRMAPKKKALAVKTGGRLGVAVAMIGALSAGTNMIPPAKTHPTSPPPMSAPGGVGAPAPLLAVGRPVEWWFAYKFSSGEFKTAADDPGRVCAFGGTLAKGSFSLKYAVASSENPTLTDGPGLIGQGGGDPLGATFSQIYNGKYYFVVWNDQFYGDPDRDKDKNCDAKQCASPWGHSKGMLAWDASGNGVLLQVTTPSWPASGGVAVPRHDGNTLGCISNDNNIGNAQDFFALRLSPDDVKAVLSGLARASVSTDVTNPQIVNKVVNGVPLAPDMAALVNALGKVTTDNRFIDQPLSSGFRMIVKPSALHVPPWQFLSSVLDSEPLLTATWWANPQIPSTRSGKDVHCWDKSLTKPPGEVDVAFNANWEGVLVGFTGGPNHAKIGVSMPSGAHHYAIFGDLNQQGQLGDPSHPNDAKTCNSSQNGRGGLFFVADNPQLSAGVAKLITGTRAPFPTP